MRLVRSLALASLLTLPAGAALATPSSTMWTPMTLDVQPYGVYHLGVDNYFTVARDFEDGAGSFPTDAGLTVGVLPFEKFRMEIGIDVLEPSDDPVYFNLKMGAPEGALWNGAPAVQLGIFSVGTKQDATDYNIVHLVIGKTIPGVGRFSVGPYVGNSKVLVNAAGEKQNDGFMAAVDRGFLPGKGPDGVEFNRLVLAADYASGDNALGAGGLGLYYFFTKDVSLLTGPVWFNEEAINGKWKWSVQLDINIPGFGK